MAEMLHGLFQGQGFILPGPKDFWEEGRKEATQGQVGIGHSQRATYGRATSNHNLLDFGIIKLFWTYETLCEKNSLFLCFESVYLSV